MNSGRIEQIGTQTDIYLQPQTPYVAEFIGANNGLHGTVTARDGDGDEAGWLIEALGHTIRGAARPGLAVGQTVVAYVRPEDIEIVEDGDGAGFANVLDGTIDRVIFEGATAQVRVDVGGREMRVDVSGNERLTLMRRDGTVRLGFDPVTVIPAAE
jgi:spermidine/putrescine transport system ATP-binding protein